MFKDHYFYSIEDVEEPLTYTKAMQHPRWAEAIKHEVSSIEKNGIWRMEALPEGKLPIIAKRIFRVKYEFSGEVLKLKARLVARSFQQTEGVDSMIHLH